MDKTARLRKGGENTTRKVLNQAGGVTSAPWPLTVVINSIGSDSINITITQTTNQVKTGVYLTCEAPPKKTGLLGLGFLGLGGRRRSRRSKKSKKSRRVKKTRGKKKGSRRR